MSRNARENPEGLSKNVEECPDVSGDSRAFLRRSSTFSQNFRRRCAAPGYPPTAPGLPGHPSTIFDSPIRIFAGVPRNSRAFLRIPGHSRAFSDMLRRSLSVLEGILRHSPTYTRIPGHPRALPGIFADSPRHSWAFPGILRYSPTLLDAPGDLRTSPNLSSPGVRGPRLRPELFLRMGPTVRPNGPNAFRETRKLL